MKTIYLCENERHVRNVYGTSERVFCKEDMLQEPARFRNTEYVFSTWGMPQFSEDEIKDTLPSLKAVFYAAGSVQKFARPF